MGAWRSRQERATFALMRGRELKCVRNDGVFGGNVFALMRGRELKFSGIAKWLPGASSPSCEGGS